jgi:hypothetical protein
VHRPLHNSDLYGSTLHLVPLPLVHHEFAICNLDLPDILISRDYYYE